MRSMGSRLNHSMRSAWESTAILLALVLAVPVAMAQDAGSEPPLEQPTQEPQPPPLELPAPEVVQPPEAPPVLIPVTVEWSIPRTDPEVADDLRFVSVWCGTKEDVYKYGRWDFTQPGTRGVVELEGPSYCAAVAYYFHDGAYRYSDMSPAVQVDPLQPAAPELMPAGMETPRYVCQTGTVRCTVNALQSVTATRQAVRTRNCTCLLR